MGRWADIVTRVRNAVGDLSQDTARAYVLEAARAMNAEARYMTTPVTVGTTSYGVGEYTLAAGVVDVYSVVVDGAPYDFVTPSQIEDIDGGRAFLRGSGGVFAEGFSAAGDPTIQIRPYPEEDGLEITGRHVVGLSSPAWSTDAPPFPEDFDQDIIHGAICAGLAEQDERLESAQWHEERFRAGIARLRARRHGRIGKGPVRIRMVR